MRFLRLQWALVIISVGCICAGMALPLWSKNGIGISGFEGNFLSIGRWVLLAAAIGALVIMATPKLRKQSWMGILGVIVAVQSSLIGWKGYKLGAIGPGTWLLLLGATLLLALAFLLRNSIKS